MRLLSPPVPPPTPRSPCCANNASLSCVLMAHAVPRAPVLLQKEVCGVIMAQAAIAVTRPLDMSGLCTLRPATLTRGTRAEAHSCPDAKEWVARWSGLQVTSGYTSVWLYLRLRMCCLGLHSCADKPSTCSSLREHQTPLLVI